MHEQSPGSGPGSQNDANLDAGVGDEAYLGQLGYRQELVRALGGFGSFAIQFSLIGISIGLFLLYGFGLTTLGPLFVVPFIIGGAFQMLVGMSVAELVSAYPVAGGAYQIINRITCKQVPGILGFRHLCFKVDDAHFLLCHGLQSSGVRRSDKSPAALHHTARRTIREQLQRVGAWRPPVLIR